MEVMDKGKRKEFIIDLNNENFNYQYDGYVNTKFDKEPMLVSKKILNGLTLEDVSKMKFNLIDKVEKFYNLYAQVTLFSVRNEDLKQDKNQNIVSCKWVCSKER